MTDRVDSRLEKKVFKVEVCTRVSKSSFRFDYLNDRWFNSETSQRVMNRNIVTFKFSDAETFDVE